MSLRFMIMPPADLNEEIVAAAALLETHLETSFPGYTFEVVDLRLVKGTKPGQRVTFGDGTRFAAIPLMGEVNSGKPQPKFEVPPSELYEAIVTACHAFDVEEYRRNAA